MKIALSTIFVKDVRQRFVDIPHLLSLQRMYLSSACVILTTRMRAPICNREEEIPMGSAGGVAAIIQELLRRRDSSAGGQ